MSNLVHLPPERVLRALERAAQAATFYGGGEPPDNAAMDARVARLESLAQDTRERLTRVESRLDNIDRNLSSHYATKADLTEAKNSIIMWVVSAIFLAQLLPALLKKFGL